MQVILMRNYKKKRGGGGGIGKVLKFMTRRESQKKTLKKFRTFCTNTVAYPEEEGYSPPSPPHWPVNQNAE